MTMNFSTLNIFYLFFIILTAQPIPKAANRSHLIIAFSDNFVIELLKTQRIYFKGKYEKRAAEEYVMNRQRADNEAGKQNKQKFKKKICGTKKKIADFQRFLWKKQLKILLFLRFFEEILMPIKAIIKHVSFSTNPSVSRKNLKKVPKKVLT